MNTRALSIGSASAFVVAGLFVSLPASAAEATCQGHAVTIAATGTGRAVTGTDGPDVISSVGFTDVVIDAKGGDDIVCAGRWSTILDGPGADTFSGVRSTTLGYTNATAGVHIDLSAGTVVDDGGATDTVIGIHKVLGSQYDDTFIGSPGDDDYNSGDVFSTPRNDVIDMGAGDDVVRTKFGTVNLGGGDDEAVVVGSTVDGGYGDDEITLAEGGTANGGPGRDGLAAVADREDPVITPRAFVLRGGPGADRISPILGWHEDDVLDGGRGLDTLDLERGSAVTVDLLAHTVQFQSGRTTFAAFEDVVGSRYADVLRGNFLHNRLVGKGGDDLLVGRGGRDTLIGGKGFDRAIGGAGRDRCVAELRRSC